jgi:hypothetical protein
MLLVSVAAIISAFSLYFYEIPTHHCPFDILQGEYRFVGYPIYGLIAFAAFFGVLTAAFEPFKAFPSLKGAIEVAQRKWIVWSLLSLAGLMALVSYPVVFGNFRLLGYD